MSGTDGPGPQGPGGPGADGVEGSGTGESVADRLHPSTLGGTLYIVVLVVVGTGLALTFSDWRLGIKVVAGALTAAAVARLVLPQRDAGMLAVRHRFTDVPLLLGVAVALWLLADTIPNQPGG